MNKSKADQILRDMRAAAAAVAEKYGCVLDQRAGARFDPEAGTFKMKVAIREETSEPKEARDFKRYAPMIGLSAEDLGKSFQSGGRTFTVAGYNARARKRPILCNGEDGKSYVFPMETIASLLGHDVGPDTSRYK